MSKVVVHWEGEVNFELKKMNKDLDHLITLLMKKSKSHEHDFNKQKKLNDSGVFFFAKHYLLQFRAALLLYDLSPKM